MSVRTTYTFTVKSGWMIAPRRCACGCMFDARRWVSLDSRTCLTGIDNVWNRKQKNFLSQHPTCTVGVMCPQCGQFTVESIRYHFPDGRREGLMRKLRRAVIGHHVGVSLLLAGLGFFLFFMGYGLTQLAKVLETPAEPAPLLSAALSFAKMMSVILVTSYVALAVWLDWPRLRRCEEELKATTDAELHFFLVMEYKRSGESLALEHLFTGLRRGLLIQRNLKDRLGSEFDPEMMRDRSVRGTFSSPARRLLSALGECRSTSQSLHQSRVATQRRKPAAAANALEQPRTASPRTCWFCGTRAAASGCSMHLPMVKVQSVPLPARFEEVVIVPRCEHCQSCHKKGGRFHVFVAGPFMVLGVIAGTPGLMFGMAAGAIIGAAVGNLVAFALSIPFRKIYLGAKGVKAKSSWRQFPTVQQSFAAGWKRAGHNFLDDWFENA